MISSLYYNILLVLGLVVSFEDWTKKKIRNKWIILGMSVCAGGLGYQLWNSLLGHQNANLGAIGEYYLPWIYYPKVLGHLALSFTAAWTLWNFSIWPAGDAKLFTVFAFFAAIIDPNIPGFPLLLFLVLLINIFIPAGIVFAAETTMRMVQGLPLLLKADWRKAAKAFVERIWLRLKDAWPYRYDYMMLITNLFAMFYAMVTVMSRFQRLALGPFGHIILFLVMLLVWGRLMGFLSDKRVGIVALTGLSLSMLLGAFHWRWDIAGSVGGALRMMISFGMFLSAARVFFYWIIEWESRRELEPEHLKEGVVLSDETWEMLMSDESLQGKIGERYSDGLSAAEVEVLRFWLAERAKARSGKGDAPPAPRCTVYQTIPFAVWIFAGTLITLSCRSTVIVLSFPYFERAAEAVRAAGPRGLF